MFSNQSKPLRVVFLLCDQMLATSVSLPLEQLHAAVTFSQSLQSSPKIKPFVPTKHPGSSPHKLEIILVSQDGQTVNSHTGLSLAPQYACNEIEKADIVYVPALWRNPLAVLRQNRNVPNWLQKLHRKGSLISGAGTGCYFLAEAGLLNHVPATTHWYYFDQFQKRYPKVLLKRQYFITQSNNIYCTGSVNSLADLTIHFIQRFFNAETAQNVERHFFHEIRRAYDSAAVFNEQDQAHPDEDIIQAQIWLKDNFEKEIKINDVAKRFKMSSRNFSRRFKQATDYSPLNYLQRIRIDAAKDLLKTSNLSISEVMLNVGYQDPTHFTRLFKQKNGTTPRQYRTTVRAKIFKVKN